MCVFGSVHLVYKKLRVFPYLSIQAVGLVRATELYRTVQRVRNMPFDSECLTCQVNMHTHLRNRTPSVEGAMGSPIFMCNAVNIPLN